MVVENSCSEEKENMLKGISQAIVQKAAKDTSGKTLSTEACIK
jgi:hypothetical protein